MNRTFNLKLSNYLEYDRFRHVIKKKKKLHAFFASWPQTIYPRLLNTIAEACRVWYMFFSPWINGWAWPHVAKNSATVEDPANSATKAKHKKKNTTRLGLFVEEPCINIMALSRKKRNEHLVIEFLGFSPLNQPVLILLGIERHKLRFCLRNDCYEMYALKSQQNSNSMCCAKKIYWPHTKSYRRYGNIRFFALGVSEH